MNTLSRKTRSALISAVIASTTAVTMVVAVPQAAFAKTQHVLAVDQSDAYKVALHSIKLIPVQDSRFVDGRVERATVVGADISAAFTNTSGKDIAGLEFVVQIQVCKYNPYFCIGPVTPIRGQYTFKNPIKAGQTRKIDGGFVLTERDLADVKNAIAGRLPVKIRITGVTYVADQEARQKARHAQFMAQQAAAARQETMRKDAATYSELMKKVQEVNERYNPRVQQWGLIGQFISARAVKERDAELTALASQYGYVYQASTLSFTKDPYAQPTAPADTAQAMPASDTVQVTQHSE